MSRDYTSEQAIACVCTALDGIASALKSLAPSDDPAKKQHFDALIHGIEDAISTVERVNGR